MSAALAREFTSTEPLTKDEPERPSLTLILGGHCFRSELEKHVPQLRFRALALCRNAAEAQDLVQDTFERSLKFESNFAVGSNLGAWLNQILFSVFITKMRKRGRERRALDVLNHDPCAWFRRDAAPLMQDLTPTLKAAVEALPPVFAQTLLLVDVADLGYKEAASELGVPLGTVMSRLHRARRMMRESLEAA